MKTTIKMIIFALAISVICLPVLAEDENPMTQFIRLMSEAGAKAFHLEDFSFESIDFDGILGTMTNSAMEYSTLNYDAALDLLQDPAVLSSLGLDKFDKDVFTAYLKDGSLNEAVTSWMEKARTGEPITDVVRSYCQESPEFSEMFLALTGKDFNEALNGLDTANVKEFLEKEASALLSPKTGAVSEAGKLLEQLVKNAARTMHWK